MTDKTPAAAAASSSPPAKLQEDFSAYAGAGLETVKASDLLVPRLSILQALSPQLNRKKAEHIPGAEVGMIADLGLGEVFPGGVLFLPVQYRKDYLEWAPRETGKGLVHIHSDPAILDHCTRDERNRPTLPNGNYVAETAQFFGLNLSAGRRMCFIAMASTQLKKARRWVMLAMGEKLQRSDGSEYTPPLYYRSYLLGTADESNNDGDWSGWTVNRSLALPELVEINGHPVRWQDVLAEAVAFQESLGRGAARADMSQDEEHAEEGAM